MSGSGIPNLRHLRAVESVARFASVSGASVHIHVSQPAVTQAIAKLEAELGVSLFDRRATGSYPTSFGRIFVRRIERFFAMAERALEAIPAARHQRRAVERLMTGRQIRSLVATTDPNAVIDRARAIGVSTTSLYRSVRELEQSLGCSLYQRTARGPVTNAVGTELARKLAVALREIEYGFEEVIAAQGNSAACLNAGVLPMSGSYAFAAAVNELMRIHPDVRLKVVDGPYLQLLNLLRSGAIDLMFGMLRRPDWAGDVEEEPLFEDSFCVVVRRGHPLTRVKDLRREQLAAYEWVAPASGTPRRLEIDRLFAGLQTPPRLGVETSSVAVIRGLLAGSDRVSILSRFEVESEENAGFFRVLRVPLGLRSPKGITTRADWLATPTHLKFIELLRENTAGARLPNARIQTDKNPLPVSGLAERLSAGG